MLTIEGLVLASPRLPRRRRTAFLLALVSVSFHFSVATALVVLPRGSPPTSEVTTSSVSPNVVAPRMVFIAGAESGRGGGGGGNRQPAPIRHAESIGLDRITLHVASPVVTSSRVTDVITTWPPLVLAARPLASGTSEQLGLPIGGVSFGTSTGPGSGGGVGTGSGTGIGSGEGPGVGSGSGGGIGGGVYRPGGVVSPPRVISEVKPSYTADALEEKIQGSVVLQLVVTRDGLPSVIRVIRSLDPAGLDEQAIKAVRQWRFAPGRRAGVPVEVLVTVVLDFSIH